MLVHMQPLGTFPAGITTLRGLQELKYAAECLAEDAKNYHAWAHRQAIVRRFGLWQQELDVVNELLQEDVRNNSAWNQRFFIFSEATNR